MNPLSYRVSAAGRAVVASQDTAVPKDYRLILWLIDFHGNDYWRRAIACYPTELLQEWLGEMEDLRLIERAPATDADAPADGILDPESTLRLAPQFGAQLYSTMKAATQALARAGCYVAEERVAHGKPFSKSVSQTDILIVEDDPDQLALADLRVSMSGYAVRVADCVSQFQTSLAEKGPPDLLLLDVMLPDGDGFDILMKLRRHPSYTALPVVMLTARNNIADIERGFALGADGYVTKPYSKNLLADVIRRVLRQSA
jgi:CheY-like chemotaxis protein